MSVVVGIHEVIGAVFIVACLLAFAWSLAISRRRRPLPPLYWRFVRMAVGGLLALQVVTGFALLALGARMPTYLHWVYAGLIVLGVALAEMLRPGSGLRDVVASIFTTGRGFDEARAAWMLMIFVAILAMRAYMTGVYGF